MNTNLTALLSRAKEIEAKATKGPWLCYTKKDTKHEIFYIDSDDGTDWIGCLELATLYQAGNSLAKEDSNLIVEARNLLPKLIQIIELQEKEIELLRNTLSKLNKRHPATWTYKNASILADEIRKQIEELCEGK